MPVLKWRPTIGTAEVATIGGLSFRVSQPLAGLVELESHSQWHGSGLNSFDAAKERAEKVTEETHRALADAFAPVLRWKPQAGGGGSTASLGPWELFARARFWSLRYCERDDWCVTLRTAPRGYAGDEAESRAAAESALRAAHVLFRVEREDGAR